MIYDVTYRNIYYQNYLNGDYKYKHTYVNRYPFLRHTCETDLTG